MAGPSGAGAEAVAGELAPVVPRPAGAASAAAEAASSSTAVDEGVAGTAAVAADPWVRWHLRWDSALSRLHHG